MRIKVQDDSNREVLFLLGEESGCFQQEMQGTAGVFWNDVRKYIWALGGVGPKKWKYKLCSGKFMVEAYSPTTVDFTW